MRRTTWVRRTTLLTLFLGGAGLLGGCSLFLNEPPVAHLAASPLEGGTPLAVTFDASASYDLDGYVASYSWNFGDGASGSGSIVVHTYATPGTFPVTVTVVDDGAERSTATCQIVARQATSYAIVIGIASYQHLPPLSFTDDDAWSMWMRLQALPGWRSENITLLLNAQATSANLFAALDRLRSTSEDDLLLLFYSGHGNKILDDDLGEELDGYDEALCLYDGVDLRDDTFAEWIAAVPMRRVVVLIDACYSGGQFHSLDALDAREGGGDDFVADLRRLDTARPLDLDRVSKSIVGVSASRSDQYSWELTALEHGAFTYALLEALDGRADVGGNGDGYISAEECYRYVEPRVRQLMLPTGEMEWPQLLDLCPGELNFAGVP